MSSEPTAQIDLTKAITAQLVAHQNVRQELVITTVDKLKLCLIEHKQHLRARREWLAPAGLLISLLTTLVAATFHDALGLPMATWTAIYILAAAGSGIATMVLLWRALASMRKSGLDQLIDKIAARSPAATSDAVSAVQSDAIAAMLRTMLRADQPPKK